MHATFVKWRYAVRSRDKAPRSCGGIGRRACLKNRCLRTYGFDPRQEYIPSRCRRILVEPPGFHPGLFAGSIPVTGSMSLWAKRLSRHPLKVEIVSSNLIRDTHTSSACGGNGRHASLRGWSRKRGAGSSPAGRTHYETICGTGVNGCIRRFQRRGRGSSPRCRTNQPLTSCHEYQHAGNPRKHLATTSLSKSWDTTS